MFSRNIHFRTNISKLIPNSKNLKYIQSDLHYLYQEVTLQEMSNLLLFSLLNSTLDLFFINFLMVASLLYFDLLIQIYLQENFCMFCLLDFDFIVCSLILFLRFIVLDSLISYLEFKEELCKISMVKIIELFIINFKD